MKQEREIISLIEQHIKNKDSEKGLDEGEILEHFRESDEVDNTLLVLDLLDREEGNLEKKDGRYLVKE